MQIYLIANSHLDPVWLWDWREGLNEGINTVRTVLDLMDEDPELTYIRGESAIYRHIEKTAPETFARIVAQVRAGRWDVVGGTYIQPDTNLAAIETLARHFTEGQRYFAERFGRKVTVAWQADSFGHTAGLPEVLAAAGIDSFAFTRPPDNVFKLAQPAFWWEGRSGARILSYRPPVGWYGSDRFDVPQRLDQLVEAAVRTGLETIGCFYGLGNHGGGPTRVQLAGIRAWAKAHPDVTVVHSGLHRLFAALRKEIARKPSLKLPVIRGELNFCLRGCYSTAARFKYLYRRCESLLVRAEKTDALVAGSLGHAPRDLTQPWRDILFNSFHDILPGSSIERAFDDQLAWTAQVLHTSQETEFAALNQLARQIDTAPTKCPPDHPSAVPLLLWNPHPHPFQGHVELEVCLDARPIWKYKKKPSDVPLRVLNPLGKALPFQEIKTEALFLPQLPWRKRVLVPVKLPAFGWNVVEMGWVEGAKKPKVPKPVRSDANWISNGEYTVKAAAGRKSIAVLHRGKSLFKSGGLTAEVFEDPWGSWGGLHEEEESFLLKKRREVWTITEAKLLESGPERATLWVRFAGRKSRIDLSFSVCRDRPAVDVRARVFWTEHGTRLKLRFPVGDVAEFEVPGATVRRKPSGEVPAGKWVAVGARFGFASDALYNYDCRDGIFSATVVRGTRFADDARAIPGREPWIPTIDLGEHKFQFLITADVKRLPQLALELEQPPIVMLAPAQKGKLPRHGSMAALQPASLHLLALKRAEDGKGFVVRVQNSAAKTVKAVLTWKQAALPLGPVRSGEIASWLLRPAGLGWSSRPVDLSENPLAAPR